MSLNQVSLLGAVVRRRCREVKNGTGACDLTLKVEDIFRVGDDFRHSTTYVDVTAWQELAALAQSLPNEASVLVQGRLASESWESGGVKKFRLKVVASSLQPCTLRRPEGNTTQPPDGEHKSK